MSTEANYPQSEQKQKALIENVKKKKEKQVILIE